MSEKLFDVEAAIDLEESERLYAQYERDKIKYASPELKKKIEDEKEELDKYEKKRKAEFHANCLAAAEEAELHAKRLAEDKK